MTLLLKYSYPFIVSLIVVNSIYLLPNYSVKEQAGEICDNAVDDDGDGLIDLNDDECFCQSISVNSLIPNPSFEDIRCCPNMESQLACARQWIQASFTSTDYLHTCGWMGWPSIPPPQPFPAGQGIAGFRNSRVVDPQNILPDRPWKEYAGTCLFQPLQEGSTYRFDLHLGFASTEYSPSLELTIYGTSLCEYVPFGRDDWTIGCPSNDPNWFRLNSTNVFSHIGNEWIKVSVILQPGRDVQAIAIGPDCELTRDTTNYYFLDNLVVAHIDSFDYDIATENHPCSDDFSISVKEKTGVNYQWYKDRVALLGENSATLTSLSGEGKYQVKIQQGGRCMLSQIYTHEIPSLYNEDKSVFCKGSSFQFGTEVLVAPGEYTHTFKSSNNCDSIVLLTLEEQEAVEVMVDAKIFPGEQYHEFPQLDIQDEGTYELLLTSSSGCDSLIVLEIEYYNVNYPNIFSPNDDGVNDFFTITGNEDLIEIEQLGIFNRWGEPVYNRYSLIANNYSGWDGTVGSQKVRPGVYTFFSRLLMRDGIERTISGNITVIN